MKYIQVLCIGDPKDILCIREMTKKMLQKCLVSSCAITLSLYRQESISYSNQCSGWAYKIVHGEDAYINAISTTYSSEDSSEADDESSSASSLEDHIKDTKTTEPSNKGVMSVDEITALGNEMSSVEEKVSFLNTAFVACFVLRWKCSLIIVHKKGYSKALPSSRKFKKFQWLPRY